jgi:hypothetical protein
MWSRRVVDAFKIILAIWISNFIVSHLTYLFEETKGLWRNNIKNPKKTPLSSQTSEKDKITN